MPPLKVKGTERIHEPYPLNEFPRALVQHLAKRIFHLRAIGFGSLSGDHIAEFFTDAVSGEPYAKPYGVADLAWNGVAWSVKSVQDDSPHRLTVFTDTEKERPKRKRLISGRNAPVYSTGRRNPLRNPKGTGGDVIDIFNSRINKAREQHDQIRLLVFLQNFASFQFTMFERPLNVLVKNDYTWSENEKGNLEAHRNGVHELTWQPSGGQFSIYQEVPTSATRFTITKGPSMLQLEPVLRLAGWKPELVKIESGD